MSPTIREENGRFVVELPEWGVEECSTREGAEAIGEGWSVLRAPSVPPEQVEATLKRLARSDIWAHNNRLARQVFGRLE
ncbi:hypothetical protein J8F10_23980 [Gemmata sp. G18]|uniref:Uncharacterized protein n=1 Tax=Gemmata palustris TaxID=2822762 RepID=A0ABS5BX80_9BACT|nr:hypothetical protein [Gemmata palustris]MBP3958319.1 hypothetical protein [Gemmata palustris]